MRKILVFLTAAAAACGAVGSSAVDVRASVPRGRCVGLRVVELAIIISGHRHSTSSLFRAFGAYASSTARPNPRRPNSLPL